MKNSQVFLSFITSIIIFNFTFAAPLVTPIPPNSTLDPISTYNCGPLDTNCFIDNTSSVGTTTINIINATTTNTQNLFASTTNSSSSNVTNLNTTNSTTSNSTSTNLYSTLLNAATALITNLFAASATFTNATTTNFSISGYFNDGYNTVANYGQVLLNTGTTTQWVSTSSLGLSAQNVTNNSTTTIAAPITNLFSSTTNITSTTTNIVSNATTTITSPETNIYATTTNISSGSTTNITSVTNNFNSSTTNINSSSTNITGTTTVQNFVLGNLTGFLSALNGVVGTSSIPNFFASLFATNFYASTTNASTSYATTSIVDNLIGTNATLTSATITNLYAPNFQVSTVDVVNGTITNSTSTNISTTNLSAGSTTLASTTVTNILGNILSFATAFINTLTATIANINTLNSGTGNFTNLNATGSAQLTNIYSSTTNSSTTNTINLFATGTTTLATTSATELSLNNALILASSTALSTTTNSLYNANGLLYFNGAQVGNSPFVLNNNGTITNGSTTAALQLADQPNVSTSSNALYSQNGILYWRGFAVSTSTGGLSASYALFGLSANQTSNYNNGDHVKFNATSTIFGPDIILDSTSGYASTTNTASVGRILLKANKTYRLTGRVGIADAFDYVGYAWYDADNNVAIGKQGSASAQSPYNDSEAQAIFTPTVDTRVELRITTNSAVVIFYANTSPVSATEAYIEVIGGNSLVTTMNLNNVIAANSSASINNGANTLEWAWNSVTSGNAFSLFANSLTSGNLFTLNSPGTTTALQVNGSTNISGNLNATTSTSTFATTTIASSTITNLNVLSNLWANLLTILNLSATNATISNATTTNLAITNGLKVTSGGTGTTTAPTFGQVLVGNTSGGFDYVATSSFSVATATFAQSTTLGASVTNATATGIFFLGADGKLSQDTANFNYDSVTKKLTVTGGIDPLYFQAKDVFNGNGAYYEAYNGNGAATSSANTGRLRYSTTTQAWEVSTNGGVYAPIAVSGGDITWVNATGGIATITNILAVNNLYATGTVNLSGTTSIATSTISSTSIAWANIQNLWANILAVLNLTADNATITNATTSNFATGNLSATGTTALATTTISGLLTLVTTTVGGTDMGNALVLQMATSSWAATSSALYNVNGTLYFNGSAVGTGLSASSTFAFDGGNIISASSTANLILATNTSATVSIGSSTAIASSTFGGTTSTIPSLTVYGGIVDKGITWTTQQSVVDNAWQSVAYGNGLFVAVANSGTGNRVMTSPDGVNWTTRNSADNFWLSVTYGNGLFVAVGSNNVMTSSDGIVWTSQVSPANNTWRSVTYGNGLFVAVSSSGTGNRVMTSSDGVNWIARNSAADNDWRSVTYGNGLFVAVSNDGVTERVMTSTDGITWTLRTSDANNIWQSVTYGNGLFVAVARSGTGNRVMTSTDGITWTLRTSAADNTWYSVTFGNGLFVAVANSGTGNRVMTSTDGITWTLRTSAADNFWNSVAYGNGMFVAVSNSGAGNRVMTSGKIENTNLATNNIMQGIWNFMQGLGIGTTTNQYGGELVRGITLGLFTPATGTQAGTQIASVIQLGSATGTANVATSTNALYNVNGSLYFNGSAVGGGALALNADGTITNSSTTAALIFGNQTAISTTSNALYNQGGTLYWNGNQLASGLSTLNVLFDTNIATGTAIRLYNDGNTIRAGSVIASGTALYSGTTIDTYNASNVASTSVVSPGYIQSAFVAENTVLSVMLSGSNGVSPSARVALVSGNDISSQGSEVQLSPADVGEINGLVPLTRTGNKAIALYQSTAANSLNSLQVISISGTVPSAGSIVQFGNLNGSPSSVGIETGVDEAVIAYADSTTNNVNYRFVDISGTTPTLSATTTVSAVTAVNYGGIDLAMNGTTTIIFAYINTTIRLRAGTINSGANTISFGAELDTGYTALYGLDIATYADNKLAMVFRNPSDSNYGHMALFNISGTTITSNGVNQRVTSEVIATSYGHDLIATATGTTPVLVYGYIDSATGLKGYAQPVTITGTNTITPGTATNYVIGSGTLKVHPSDSMYINPVTPGRFVTGFSSSATTAGFGLFTMSSTVADYRSQYFGIASAGAAQNATGTVTLWGNILSNTFTNLVAGATYYLDSSGQLTTTATNYLAGKALSSTQLSLNNPNTTPSANSSGSVVASYLNASYVGATESTNVGAGGHFKFNTVSTQYGSDITLDTSSAYSSSNNTASIGRFTLKAGKTYEMTGYLTAVTQPTSNNYAWYNADTGVQIGSESDIVSVTNVTSYLSGSGPTAIFTPAVDTRVEIRFSAGITSYESSNVQATIKVIAGNAAVTGQSVDYVEAGLTADYTPVVGTTIPLVTTAGNISNTGGVFTLTAGKTYELNAYPTSDNTGSAGTAIFQWRDLTNGVFLGQQSRSYSLGETTNTHAAGYAARAIITPSVNITVALRPTTISGGSPLLFASGTSVTIKQLGTTATTEYSNNILGNFTASSTIMSGTLSEYINHIQIVQASSSLTLSIPSPTNTALSRIVYIDNTGTANFTMHGVTVGAGETNAFKWNGTTWKSFGAQANNVAAEYGTVVITASSFNNSTTSLQSFTLPTAGVWEVEYNLSGYSTIAIGDSAVFITDASNNVVTNSQSHIYNSGPSNVSPGSSVSMSQTVRITTTGAATYTLKGQTGSGAAALNIYSGGCSNGQGSGASCPTINYKKISGYIPVTGQTVDYVYASVTSASVASASVVPLVTSSGNIPNTGGIFTLAAGKTYKLSALAHSTSVSGSAVRWAWRNVTTNTVIGNQGTEFAPNNAGTESSFAASEYVFTPTVNTQVQVENQSGVTVTMDVTATIQQLGSTAITGVTWSSLLAPISNLSLDNLNYKSTFNWSTATTSSSTASDVATTTGLFNLVANALTIGNLLNIDTSSASTSALAMRVKGGVARVFGTNYATSTPYAHNVDFGNTSRVRVLATTSAFLGITGIAGGVDGKEITLVNSSTTQSFTIYNHSTTTSSAVNRIITGTGNDLTVAGDAAITLVYDDTASTTGRWRVIGGSGGGGTSVSSTNLTNFTASTSVGTAAATVDTYTNLNIAQASSSVVLTLPNPTITTAGKTITVNNTGSVAFTMYDTVITTAESAIFIWNGTNWLSITGKGNVAGEILVAKAAGDQSVAGIAATTNLVIDTTVSTNAFSITNSGGGTYTLKAGKTYQLNGSLSFVTNGSTFDEDFQWYDITGAAYIGSAGNYQDFTGDSATPNSQPVAVFTPSVDSVVAIRSESGAVSSNVTSLKQDSNITISVVGGNAPVTGQSVDYVYAKLSADQTTNRTGGVDHIKFDTASAGNIPLSTASYVTTLNVDTVGRFTLTAGKTYSLEAGANTNIATGNLQLYWRNADTGVQLTPSNTSIQDSDDAAGPSTATAIFTPTTNTRVEVFIVSNTGSTNLAALNTYAKITQIGSSAMTSESVWSIGGNTFSSSGVQSLGSIANNAIQFIASSTVAIFIGTSTNVGIGTTTNMYGGALSSGLTFGYTFSSPGVSTSTKIANVLTLFAATSTVNVSTTSNALYNVNNSLYWNGSKVALNDVGNSNYSISPNLTTSTTSFPYSVTVDPSGNIYAYVLGNTTLVKYNSAGVYQSSIVLANINSAGSIASDASGNIYLPTTTGNITRVSSAGSVTAAWATGFTSPAGIVYDSYNNNLIVGSSGTSVYRVNMSGTILNTYASGNTLAQVLTVDSTGNVFVINGTNNSVSKITLAGTVTTVTNSGIAIASITTDNANNAYAGAAGSTGIIYKFNFTGSSVSTFVTLPVSQAIQGLKYVAATEEIIPQLTSSANVYKVDSAGVATLLFTNAAGGQVQANVGGQDSTGNIYVPTTLGIDKITVATAGSGITSSSLLLTSISSTASLSTTTNELYNLNGTLYFNGSALSGGLPASTTSLYVAANGVVNVGTSTATASTMTIVGTTTNGTVNIFSVASSSGAGILTITNDGHLVVGTTSTSTSGLSAITFVGTSTNAFSGIFNIASSSGRSLFFVNGQGVAVGTTSTTTIRQAALTIVGTSTFSNAGLINIASSTGSSLLFMNGNGGLGIGTTTNVNGGALSAGITLGYNTVAGTNLANVLVLATATSTTNVSTSSQALYSVNGNLYWNGGQVLANSPNATNSAIVFGKSGITTLGYKTGSSTDSQFINLNSGLGTNGTIRLTRDGELKNISKFTGNSLTLLGNFASTTYAVATRTDHSVGLNSYGVELGDINGDGLNDIVNYSNSAIYYQRNLGNRTFAAVQTISFGTNIAFVRLVDVNNDGKLDVVGQETTGGAAALKVLINNGQGGFQAVQSYSRTGSISNGYASLAMATGDLNGDGYADIVSPNSSAQLEISMNRGDGTFASAVQVSATNNQRDVAVGDINGDGSLDIVTSDEVSAGYRVFLNNGRGTFTAGTNASFGNFGAQILLRDVNGDGVLDILAVNIGGALTSALGNGNGTFQAATNFLTSASTMANYRLATGDLNGDGNMDIVANNGTNTNIPVYLGNGHGSYSTSTIITNGQPISAYSLYIADMNGDGRGEIVEAGNGSTYTYIFWAQTPKALRFNPSNNSLTISGDITSGNIDQFSQNYASSSVWTSRNQSGNGLISDVIWASGFKRFYSLGFSLAGTDNRYSSDGITWTSLSGAPGGNNTSFNAAIAYSPDLNLISAFNTGTNNVYTISAPGTTVSSAIAIPAGSSGWSDMVWSSDDRQFVAVCATSAVTDCVATSPDGTSWTRRTIPSVTGGWYTIAYSPELGIYVAGAGGASTIMTSPDGITWTSRSTPGINNYQKIIWVPKLGLFVAALNNGGSGNIATSPDGTSWTLRTTPTPGTYGYYSLAWAPEAGLLVAGSNNGSGPSAGSLIASTNGITWHTKTASYSAGVGTGWAAGAWSPDLGMFVFGNGNSDAANAFMTSTPIKSFSPAANKRLMWGDLRVGLSSASVGCLESFTGTNLGGTCSSDSDLKTGVTTLDSILNKFADINFVNFFWNATATEVMAKSGTATNTGVIAQQIADLFPELVSTDPRGFKQVDYSTLSMYGLKATQELAKNASTSEKQIANNANAILSINSSIASTSEIIATLTTQFSGLQSEISTIKSDIVNLASSTASTTNAQNSLIATLTQTLNSLNTQLFGSNSVTALTIEEITASSTISVDEKIKALGVSAQDVNELLAQLASTTSATTSTVTTEEVTYSTTTQNIFVNASGNACSFEAGVCDIASTTEILTPSTTTTITTDTTFVGKLIARLLEEVKTYLATATSVFVGKVETNEICVKKADGTPVCLNADQLEEIKNSLNTPAPSPEPIPATPNFDPQSCIAPQVPNTENTACVDPTPETPITPPTPPENPETPVTPKE